ncbi:MAG: hypothetical protein JNK63_07475 [Chthonomonas sp.]|nr:hypothetical protein [Chthonomonas sp.]
MKLNPEITKKLVQEESLQMAESHELDQMLSASDGVGVTLRGLEDSEPSMAWRSGLNERLLSMHAPKRVKARVWGVTGFGTAVAVAASVFFFAKPAPTSMPSSSLASRASAEQIMLDAHRMNVFALSTGAGDGSEPLETSSEGTTHQWTEADLGAF